MSELPNTTDSGRSISDIASLGKEVKRDDGCWVWNLLGDLGNSICLNGAVERIFNDLREPGGSSQMTAYRSS